MTTFNTMQAIRVRFLPPTNTKQSRLVADNTHGDRIVINFNDELSVDEQTFKLAQRFAERYHEYAPELNPVGGIFRNEVFYTFKRKESESEY